MATKREAFEDWARRFGFNLERNAEGNYRDNRTGAAWFAWRAALAVGPKEITE